MGYHGSPVEHALIIVGYLVIIGLITAGLYHQIVDAVFSLILGRVEIV